MHGIGNALRHARIQRGDDLAACSAATGIGPVFLDAIESDRFDDLPPTAHAPDLVERYARYLGLDAQHLSGETSASVADDPDADTQPIPIVRRSSRREPTLAWIGAGAAIGVAGLIVLGGGLGSESNGPEASAGVTPTRSTTPPPVQTSPASAAGAETPRTEAPSPLRPTAPTSAVIELRIGAKAGKTVWVEVRRGDVSGEQMFAGIVGGGVTRVIQSARPLWLGVAWAPNLTVTLNDEVIDATGGTESYRVTARGLAKLGTP